MADRTFVRDSLGRFARVAGAAATKAAKRAAAEAASDEKQLQLSKLETQNNELFAEARSLKARERAVTDDLKTLERGTDSYVEALENRNEIRAALRRNAAKKVANTVARGALRKF